MKNAPVVIFLYNRPYQTIKTLLNLQKNFNSKNTELIVYSDGYKKKDSLDKKKVEVTRYIAKNITGFKSKKIFIRNKNFGLYKNITSGLDSVFKKYNKAIILEDDILVNKFFINYMNKALKIYKNNSKVSSIHGWFCEHKKKIPSTFFLRGSDIWGWATWKRSWIEFNRNPKKLIEMFKKKPELIRKFNLMDSYDYFSLLTKRSLNLNQSWGILWNASNFLKEKYYLNFSNSLCINIGQDYSGTHSTVNEGYFNQKLLNKKIHLTKQKIEESLFGERVKSNFFQKYYKVNFLKKILKRIILKLFEKINLRKNRIVYKGPYSNWIEASKNSKGYNDSEILKRVKKNTIISNNNVYFFERDGSLLKKNTISNNQLYLILNIINKKKRKLNIVDFGGSLGSMYFKIKDIINLNYKNKWNIIEQKLFVNEGNRSFKKQNLFFYDDLNKIRNQKIDLIILSGSLQYMEDPAKILKKIFNKKPDTILLERTPVSINKKKNEIFVQKRGDSSYPSWYFSENLIKNLFKKNNYDLIDKFSSEFDHNLFIDKQEIKFEGYIFKIKNDKKN